jgi:hypothetical protein
MSTDYAEKEREFVASLTEDTGRDLDAWMAAITESGFSDKNAIIDWLRLQGFAFNWASWLERIHHNGGRLIYADNTSDTQVAEAPQPPRTAPSVSETPQTQLSVADRPAAAPQPHPPDADIERLLAAAKGLRPLAEHVLREVARIVPNCEQKAQSPVIMISAPEPFAALHPSSRKLRLFADFGPAAGSRAKTAEAINRMPPPFPGMLLLDDARSIDDEFARLIRAASSRQVRKH